tara:strand:+ start:1740 stop:2633 length:894 start_codon:yes stop_codon:yes gene_type:complete
MIKDRHKIDCILANSRAKEQEFYSIVGCSYFIENKNGLRHLTYPPGFGSGFVSALQVEQIITSLDQINHDTSFLLFLNENAVTNFNDSYNISPNKKYTSISQRTAFYLDLTNKSQDQILLGFDKGIRQKAKSKGIKYKILTSYDERFYCLYESLTQKKNFAKSYHYNKVDFEELFREDNVYFFGIEVENKLVSAASFRFIKNNLGSRMDYLLSASSPESSSKWTVKVIWNGIRLALQKECSIFNFGGGATDGDSLSKFKLGFGSNAAPFFRCKVVNRLGKKRDSLMQNNILENKIYP